MTSRYHWLFYLTVLLSIAIAQGVAGYFTSATLNSGIAFNISLPTIVIYLVTVGFIIAITAFYHLGPHSLFWSLACGLVVGGGLSNLLDRLIHQGAVRDYIPFLNSIINVADVFIVGGIVAICVILNRYGNNS